MTAEVPNPAVSHDILKQIWKWKQESCSEEDVIVKLRIKTVPAGYEYHMWHPGMHFIFTHTCICMLSS